MLHYTIFFLSWIGSATQPCDLAAFSPIDTASAVHQEQLVACLKTRTSFVKTVSRPDHRITELGTSSVFRGFPISSEAIAVPSTLFSPKVTGFVDENNKPFELFRHDQRLGFIILGRPSQAGRFVPSDLPLGSGRVVFAVDEQQRLVRAFVVKRGSDARSFYWVLNVALPLGTPLFDGQGRILSMVAFNRNQQAFILPSETLLEWSAIQKNVSP